MRRKRSIFLLVLAFMLTPVWDDGQALTIGGEERINGQEIASARKVLEEAGRSSLYPEDWYPGLQDDEGRFLHDFSYAGYHRGEQPIPVDIPGRVIDVTETPYDADNTGVNDSTSAIQQAIDQVGAEGGGVVYLPAGTYKIKPQGHDNFALRIKDSGVVLRGAGVDQTFLYNEETVMRGKQIISVRGEGYAWTRHEEKTAYVTSDLLAPTSQIPVDDVAPFDVGDWVVVSSDVTADFLAEHEMTGWWDALLDTEGPAFYRQVVAIDADTGTVTIDAPTRYSLKMRDRAKVYKVEAPLSEVGIEDLSIGNKQHPGSGFGSGDYKEEGTGAYEVHASKMIHLEQVVNAWVKRVNTYRPETNEEDYHILSNGIVLRDTRHVSILESHLSNPQYRGGGGNGYLFELLGNDNLIQDSHAKRGRHNYSFKLMHANGNVIHRSTSTDPSLLTDFHMRLSMSNLLDGLVLNNDTIHAGVRPSDNHGMTTSQSVIWNTTGNGYHPTTTYLIDSRQYGHGYVIGTQGSATNVKTTPTVVSGRETSPEDFVEGEGQGTLLAPQSLYEDQLQRRLERETTQVSAIKVDGQPVRHFLFGKLEYHVELPYGTKANDIPEVTVATMNENATVEINDAQTLPGTTEIDVSGDDGTVQRYQLHFTIAAEPAELAELFFIPDKSQPGWKAMGSRIESGSSAHFRLFGTMSDGRPADLMKADEVSYSSSDEEVAVIDAEGLLTAVNEGTASITASVTFGDVTISAHVDVTVVPAFPEPDRPSLSVTEVTASEHDGNVPENTLDGDLDTRWSAEGDGQWIQYDLDGSYDISAVSIAFHNGDQRATFFELEVSEDGSDWSHVYSGQSSGETLQFEMFEFDPIQAQYVRFVGFGNTINAWNSLTEFRIHPPEEPVSARTLQQLVERLEAEGAFASDRVAHALDVHLTVVDHFEKQKTGEKVVKHMEGFKQLLDHQKDEDLIMEEAYHTLSAWADNLIEKWQ